jgi:hypothetical protein
MINELFRNLDESGYHTDAANRKKSHSGIGVPARKITVILIILIITCIKFNK